MISGGTQIWPGSMRVTPSAKARACRLCLPRLHPEPLFYPISAMDHAARRQGMACDVQGTDAAVMAPLIAERCALPTTRPVQLEFPRGAAVFRDLRCWHRGMPNWSRLPRHMLGTAFCAERDPGAECSWLGKGKRFHVFSDSCKAAFRHADGGSGALVHRNVQFARGAVDHRGRTIGDEGFEEMLGGDEEEAAIGLEERLSSLLPVDVDSSMPWWLQEMAAGRLLDRGRGVSRL